MTSLDIVIVNWNTGNQLSNCLDSICHANLDGINLDRVIVVDNNSCDDSLNSVNTSIRLPLTIIRNSSNRGFAAACNQGASGGSSQYILFLNPDTLLHENSLQEPVSFMSRPDNSQVGICGIQLLDKNSSINRHCCRFPSWQTFLFECLGLNHLSPIWFPGGHLREWSHDSSKTVDHVIGAFYLVRRFLFEKLSGFDESFFIYLEDLDFSLRAYNLGYTSFYLSSASAYHKGGGSSESIKPLRLAYSQKSKLIYIYKHFEFASAFPLTLLILFIHPIIRLIYSVFSADLYRTQEVILGYFYLWISVVNSPLFTKLINRPPRKTNSNY
jgi:hypothetical protein